MKKNNLIILMNTPYLELYGDLKNAAGKYFHLGLGYIASVLKKNDFEVEYMEPGINYKTPQDLTEDIHNKNPLIIGISCVTPNFNLAIAMIQNIREKYKGYIAIGGPHASYFKTEILAHYPNINFLIYGEGEQTFLQLCQNLKQNNPDLSNIKGLCWRDKDNQIHLNPPRPLIDDIDSLPFPARDLVDITLYSPQTFLFRSKNSISIFTSRGCPARCIFCASKITMGKSFRFRSVANIIEEIEHLIQKYQTDYILIKDDTFTINKQHVIDFCNQILEKRLKFKWHCMIRANTVDYELLTLMKKAGCTDVFIGVESGNEQTLKKIKKGITKEQIINAVKNCKKVGIQVYASFIFGFPDETDEMRNETIEFACQLSPLFAGFSILIPYPGTEIFNTYLSTHPFNQFCWEDFMASSGKKAVKNFKQADLKILEKTITKAQLRFYLRPSQIARLIKAAFKYPRLLQGIVISAYCLLLKISKQFYRRKK